jgi:hypothetical protein
MDGNNGWYDAAYGDDPSTDNIFGREDRVERRDAALHAFLKSGSRLSDYVPLRGRGDYHPHNRDPAALTALLDRILGAPL